MNRIEEQFRDPTLDQPVADYFIVRLPQAGFVVAREEAERILCAVTAVPAPRVVRCQTVVGSVVFLRPDAVEYVHECTRAQRDAERRFWEAIDDEDED
jgi:hypothetical protein